MNPNEIKHLKGDGSFETAGAEVEQNEPARQPLKEHVEVDHDTEEKKGENRSLETAAKIPYNPIFIDLKELLEAENEPLPDVDEYLKMSIYEDDEDYVEKEFESDRSTLDLENSAVESEPSETNKSVESYSGKFDKIVVHPDLGVAWVNNTPAKTHNNLQFKTPYAKQSVHVQTPYQSTTNNKIGHTPEQRKFSDKNPSVEKVCQPRVHCSIPIASYLTPLNRCQTLYSERNHSSISRNDCIKSNKENVVSDTQIQSFNTHNSKDYNFKIITVNRLDYLVYSHLGRGGTADVLSCIDPSTKSEKAVKMINLKGHTTNANACMNEIKMLKQLQNCDRVIQMFDHEVVEDQLILVLEKGGNDLSKILKDTYSNDHLPEYLIIYYWMEILKAVQQVHNRGIIHSDLKPSNFLACSTGVKVIDFGIATSTKNNRLAVKNYQVGSPNYVSPEALINIPSSCADSPNFGKQKYMMSFKSDVWSLGCILYQMVYKKTPFQHITRLETKLQEIVNPAHKIPFPEAPWAPPTINTAIRDCLKYDQHLRPSLVELIQVFEKNVSN